jgi:hypothetical protein
MATDVLDSIDWDEFAVVFAYDPSEGMNSTFGFAYADDGPVPISFIPFMVSDAVDAYRSFLASHSPKGEEFSRMLFQFNRVSGRVNADFAYEGDARWRPAADLAEVLRPNLS